MAGDSAVEERAEGLIKAKGKGKQERVGRSKSLSMCGGIGKQALSSHLGPSLCPVQRLVGNYP